VHFVRKPLLH